MKQEEKKQAATEGSIMVWGDLAYHIKKAREDEEFFNSEKAMAASALAVLRNLKQNLPLQTDGYVQFLEGLESAEASIHCHLYYMRLMESKDGNSYL